MNENSYIKIEEYINGSMSRDEQLSFEAELITNEELSVAFKIYKQIETEMRTHENCSGQEALLRKSLEKLNIKYLGNEFQQQAGLEEATPVIYINEDQFSLSLIRIFYFAIAVYIFLHIIAFLLF